MHREFYELHLERRRKAAVYMVMAIAIDAAVMFVLFYCL